MVIEITNPGKVLVALALAKTQLATRHNELANCTRCSEQLRDSYCEAVTTVTDLIRLIQELS